MQIVGEMGVGTHGLFPTHTFVVIGYIRLMDPLHATIEEFAAEGFTHIECHCPRCRMTRLRPISWLSASRWDSPSHSFQHGYVARSAADQFTRSNRGDWRTCWVSRWGAEGGTAALCDLAKKKAPQRAGECGVPALTIRHVVN
jgi:hypothetical protein